MKDLIVKVTGSVVESNLEEWKVSALGYLDTIPTELVTDLDFGEAAKNIKACKEIEDRLDVVKSEIINQTADIAKALEVIAEVQAQYRDTRLELTRKEKTEKENRKREIVELGYQALSAIYSRSDVAFYLKSPDKSLVTEAIKSKKTLVSMDSAILDVIEMEKDRIRALETNFHTNIVLIDSVEAGSLFPDKMTIALGTEVEVRATIDARLAKRELEQIQAKEREAAEKIAKEEAEKVAREEAERIAKEEAEKVARDYFIECERIAERIAKEAAEKVVAAPVVEQAEPPKAEIQTPHFIPAPPSFDAPSEIKYLVSFIVETGKEDAILLATQIRAKSGVSDVKVTRC